MLACVELSRWEEEEEEAGKLAVMHASKQAPAAVAMEHGLPNLCPPAPPPP